MATVKRTAFVKDIQEQLFAGNEFIQRSISHDGFVNDLSVEVPQAGSAPVVEENRSIIPGIVSDRTDDKQIYSLIEFSTNPIRLPNIEKIQESYDKRMSIMKGHIDAINDRIGLRGAYNWAGATLVTDGGQILRTTGTDTAGIAPPSCTGNRKALKLFDLSQAAKKMDKDHMPQAGRYLLMPSDMYWNFLAEEPTVLNKEYNPIADADVAMGVVKKIYGWNIILRPYTVTFATGATPTKKDVSAAIVATDHWGVLGWHEGYVAKALGAVKFLSKQDDPAYYGDIYSALVMFNNVQLRKDGKGIVTIVQV